MGAQYFVRLLIRDKLDKAFSVINRAGATIGNKGKLTYLLKKHTCLLMKIWSRFRWHIEAGISARPSVYARQSAWYLIITHAS